MNDFIELKHPRGVQYIRVSKITAVVSAPGGGSHIWTGELSHCETTDSVEEVILKIKNAPK